MQALKIVTAMARGLREGFKNYGALLIAETLCRFKEKKATVNPFKLHLDPNYPANNFNIALQGSSSIKLVMKAHT